MDTPDDIELRLLSRIAYLEEDRVRILEAIGRLLESADGFVSDNPRAYNTHRMVQVKARHLAGVKSIYIRGSWFNP